MSKKLVYRRPSGKVSIVIPSPEHLSKFNTEQEAIDALKLEVLPNGASSITEVDDVNIPASRLFRDAFEIDTVAKQIKHNLPLAQAKHLERIRSIRNKKLAALDIQVVRALEDSDTVTLESLKTEKQILRDIPQTFDLANLDVNNPAALWPAELDLHPDYE